MSIDTTCYGRTDYTPEDRHDPSVRNALEISIARDTLRGDTTWARDTATRLALWRDWQPTFAERTAALTAR